jgi:hypothetical protein
MFVIGNFVAKIIINNKEMADLLKFFIFARLFIAFYWMIGLLAICQLSL